MEIKKVQSQHVRMSPDGAFRTVYANNANLTATPFDVRIEYGDSSPNLDGSVIYTKPQVQVVMSIEHARALFETLGATLRKGDASKKRAARKRKS